MTHPVENIFIYLIPPDVFDLPLVARRAFVLTLPLSGPLWIIWAVGWFLLMSVGGALVIMGSIVIGVLAFIFLLPLLWLRDQISTLWWDGRMTPAPAQPRDQQVSAIGPEPEARETL